MSENIEHKNNKLLDTVYGVTYIPIIENTNNLSVAILLF
jgi:hypothetical protein